MDARRRGGGGLRGQRLPLPSWGLLFLVSLVFVSCRGVAERPEPNGQIESPPAGLAARQSFWAARGVVLESRVPDWAPCGEPVTVEFVVRNHGVDAVELVFSRRTATWPFGHSESARAHLDIVREATVVGLGTHRREERRDLMLPGRSLVVQPGEETGFTVDVETERQRWRPYEVLAMRAAMYPLAVEIGEEPERFVALNFPLAAVKLAPAEVLEVTAHGDWSAFEDSIVDRPEELVAYAERYADLDRIRVTDELLRQLPGRTLGHRAALLAALECVTGQRHGDHVDRWRSWWASGEGARWAMSQRREQANVEGDL